MTANSPTAPPLLQRVGVIGDVHGHAAALEAAVHSLRGLLPALDAVFCTGDIPGSQEGSDTGRCCRLLAESGVHTVLGNHDRWAVENESARILIGTGDEWPLEPDCVAFLKSLTPTREYLTPRGPLLLCHGTGDDDLMGVYPGDDENALASNHRLHAIHGEGRIRYMVAGHTHQRMVRTLGHLTILNAGALAYEDTAALPIRISPGTALRRKNPCFSVLDFEEGVIQFYNIAREGLAVTKAECFPL